MEVYKIPPELAAKYIPPNRLGQGCGPWVQVLGQEPVVGQGAYFKFRGYREELYMFHAPTTPSYGVMDACSALVSLVSPITTA